MKAALTSPCYLVRNPHSYCFRMVVPADLQKFVGRTELRYTLRTGSLHDAKQKARLISGQVQLLFRSLRKGDGKVLAKLSADLLHGLIQQYIKNSIESWDREFYEKPDEAVGLRPYEVIDYFDDIREQLINGLNRGDFSTLEQPIDELLKKNGIEEVEADSLEYRRLCAEIHKAEIRLLPLHRQHMRCDFSYRKDLPEIFPELYSRKSEGPPPALLERRSETIQHVFDAFWKETSPSWKSRTVTEYKTCHKHLIEFLGRERMIHTVDYPIGRQYKEVLSDTRTKRGGPMSPARVDIYLGYAAQVFNWAIRQHYIESNPFAGLQFGKKKQKRADQQRDAFSIEDLKKMFVDSKYFGLGHWRENTHPHFFWIPLIGLYTGARLEEIAQLYVKDVQLIEGVYCLDINENSPDKSIKTGEQRVIPLHDFLVKDVDFIGYVQSLPQDGRVFPELKRINYRYSHGFSMWFRKFKTGCGVTGKKTFHSFRHLVTSFLLERDVPENLIAQLVGHTTKSQTTGRYGKRFRPELLKEKVVDKLAYGLDLRHLKKGLRSSKNSAKNF